MNSPSLERFVNAIASDLEEGGFREVTGTRLRRNLTTAVQAALPMLGTQAGGTALSAQPSPGGQDALPRPLEDLRDALQHAIDCADGGDDYNCGRPMIDAMTTLGLMRKTGRGLWSVNVLDAQAVVEALASRQQARIYGCCAQPEGDLHTAECPNMRHLAARQPVGEAIGEIVYSDEGGLQIEFYDGKPLAPMKLYGAPPAKQPAQVYLDGLDRALGEAIDQRDRYHEVADDLAAHIARITGVDIGEHSSANCPWQNAIEAAEQYKPAQAMVLERYDAGLLSDVGGGDTAWWLDYLRAELGRAHDHYQHQVNPAKGAGHG